MPHVLRQLHAEFNEELQALKDEFLSEREMLITMHEKEVSDIKDIIFAMEVGGSYGWAARVSPPCSSCTRTKRARPWRSLRASVTRSARGIWKVLLRFRLDELPHLTAARSTLNATLEATIGELWDQFQAVRFLD